MVLSWNLCLMGIVVVMVVVVVHVFCGWFESKLLQKGVGVICISVLLLMVGVGVVVVVV